MVVFNSNILEQLCTACINIAGAAGRIGLDYYNRPGKVLKKFDDSPVTLGDLAVHQYITAELASLNPKLPILSEESVNIAPYSQRKLWEYYWLIDPIDGTKEFIAHTGEFTVNIALIRYNNPIMAVIYVPVTGVVYYAVNNPIDNYKAAYKKSNNLIKLSLSSDIDYKSTAAAIKIITSSRQRNNIMIENFLAKYLYPLGYNNIVRLELGSSLKFCVLAEGSADLYPRFGPTSEWDTAAGQCILTAVGGTVVAMQDYNPLLYNKSESMLNPNFLAISKCMLNIFTNK